MSAESYLSRGVSPTKDDVKAAVKNQSKGVFPGAFCKLIDDIAGDPDYCTAIHADGAFLTSRAAYRYMKASGKGGKIIFMGSAHSHVGSKLKSPYCFAKHGLLGLCRVLAKEGAEYGIHTYVVCPGFVKTPLVEKQIPEQSEALGISEEEVIKNVMLKDTVDGIFTTVEDIANAVYYLTEDSGAMTGQSIVLSHGWHMN